MIKPSPAALAWAKSQRFSALVSAETIESAYSAHIRIMAKIAARKVKA